MAVVESKSSLYLFYHHTDTPNSHLLYSLYKIELDPKTDSKPSATTLSPVLELPNDGQYPTEIKCARLGSKLYFVDRNLLKNPNACDVYVFDMITNNFSKMDASLNTCKPDPCIFAANGKLYVLATVFSLDVHVFECYDPVTNEWSVLDNPPAERKVEWEGCTVLEKRGQVLLLGFEPCRGQMVRYVYDAKNNTWRRNYLVDNVTLLTAATDDDFYYGLSNFGGGPLKARIDIITLDDETELDFECPDKDTGLVEVDNDTFCKQPYFGCNSRFLRYIGIGYFCYMTAGMLPHPDHVHDQCGEDDYCPPDEHTRAITIILFKEKKSQGGCFEVEIVGSQEYVMPAPFYNMAELAECIVVNPVSTFA